MIDAFGVGNCVHHLQLLDFRPLVYIPIFPQLRPHVTAIYWKGRPFLNIYLYVYLFADNPLGFYIHTIAHCPSHSSPCGARGIEFDVRFAPFFSNSFFRGTGPAGPFCVKCPPLRSLLTHVAQLCFTVLDL